MDAISIQDTQTVEEIREMVERLSRKVDSIIDPDVRDGIEDATDIMLAAVTKH